MNFSRQDLYTFVIGLVAAMTVSLGEALVNSTAIIADPEKWAVATATGLLAAAGRYFATWIAQRGLA